VAYNRAEDSLSEEIQRTSSGSAGATVGALGVRRRAFIALVGGAAVTVTTSQQMSLAGAILTYGFLVRESVERRRGQTAGCCVARLLKMVLAAQVASTKK
jgi:hypothetical protein